MVSSDRPFRMAAASSSSSPGSTATPSGQRNPNASSAWAFRQFVQKPMVEAGTVVAEAGVWMGNHTRVGLIAPEDVSLLLSATNPEPGDARVEYRGPIEAPIAEGEAVAELVIPREDLPDARIPLVSDREVTRGGFLPRVRTSALVLLNKALVRAQALR